MRTATSLHRRMIAAASVGLVFAGISEWVQANSTASPAAVAQAIGNAKPLGQSRLVVFGFNIYDARLWTGDGFSAANYASQPFALELRYLRNFSGAMIAERSLKEMQRLGSVSDEQAVQWLDKMKRLFPDVKKGDQLIGIHRPEGISVFTLNGKPLGEVRDRQFSRLFFGIWLSPQTSEPKMRGELIGSAQASSTGLR
jgi:Chalcone isomerase-like